MCYQRANFPCVNYVIVVEDLRRLILAVVGSVSLESPDLSPLAAAAAGVDDVAVVAATAATAVVDEESLLHGVVNLMVMMRTMKKKVRDASSAVAAKISWPLPFAFSFASDPR